MKRFALIALAISACSIQKSGPTQSAVTAIGDVARVEVTVTGCNSTIEHIIELDLAAAGKELSLEDLTVEQGGLADGGFDTTGVTVPPDHGFRIRCVNHPGGDASMLTPSESEAVVEVVIATEDQSAAPSLIAKVTTTGRAFDNCQNVLSPDGCTIVSEF